MTAHLGRPWPTIVVEFVDKLPAQLHTDGYLDLADRLAARPGVWAVWPGEDDVAPEITKPGEVVALDLLGEGPGGAVEFTRRAGRTYCRWVTT